MVGTILLLVRNQLLGRFFATNDIVIYEVYEAEGMRPMSELKIDTVTSSLALDASTLICRIILQN